MDYKIFSSNRSILQSSAIHPIIATADKSGHFVPVGVTSAFLHTRQVFVNKWRNDLANFKYWPNTSKKTCFNDAQTFLIYNRTTIDVNEYKWIQEEGSIPIQNGDIVGVPHFTQFTSH